MNISLFNCEKLVWHFNCHNKDSMPKWHYLFLSQCLSQHYRSVEVQLWYKKWYFSLICVSCTNVSNFDMDISLDIYFHLALSLKAWHVINRSLVHKRWGKTKPSSKDPEKIEFSSSYISPLYTVLKIIYCTI